jgi:HSP20 family protein
MRRNEEYLPAWRERELLPMSTSTGYGSTVPGTSPWLILREIPEDMDRVVSQFLSGLAGSGRLPAANGQQRTQTWAPSVDISQSDTEWRIEADLPGVKKEDVNVEVRAGYLVLGAETRPAEQPQDPQEEYQGQPRQHTHRERRYGSFQRVLTLPDNLDEANIHCEFQNGVLTVHVPKMEQRSPLQRRIPVGEGIPPGNGHRRSEQPTLAAAKGGEASSVKVPQDKKPTKS